MVDPVLIKIVLSLALGALIGIERERRGKGELVEGLRTFMLISVLGTLTAFVSENILSSPIVLMIGFILVGLLTIFGYMAKSRKQHVGLTTEIAFLVTYFMGVIVFFDSYPFLISVTIGIVLTFVLVSKEFLHRFAHQLSQHELWDAVIFGIIAFIIFPLLPKGEIRPFEIFDPSLSWIVLNPSTAWLSIVLVLVISFAGYIAMKLFGVRRGLALTGFFGGLASSTAVAISMSEKVKSSRRIFYSAAFAVAVASSTMFLRTIGISSLINSEVAIKLLIPLSLISLAGYIGSYTSWKHDSREKAVVSIGSPLALRSAFLFGIFFSIILIVSTYAKTFYGATAILAVAAIAGLIEVDAITISLSTLALTSISPINAVMGILVANISNTISKLFLSNWIGGRSFGKEVGKSLITMISMGIIALYFLSLV